jgi:hypothetical protein
MDDRLEKLERAVEALEAVVSRQERRIKLPSRHRNLFPISGQCLRSKEPPHWWAEVC